VLGMRKPQAQRPLEDAALYNPAFLALLLRRCVDGYFQEHKEGLSLLLGHLGVSMALTADVRAALTMRINTKLGTWIADNTRARAKIPQISSAFVPYINEAVLFALQQRVVALDNGTLIAGTYGPATTIKGGSREVVDCQRAAAYLGRWFAVSGSHSTVAALLGVRP
jgi:hypothetical protein